MQDDNLLPTAPPTPPTLVNSASGAPSTAARVADWLSAPRILAIVALIIALGTALYSFRQSATLTDELAKRLAQADTRGNESRVLAGQAQETSRELLVKVGILEQKLAEWQNQQLALESLYQELARGRDETVMAEIEQLLVSASHELQLAGNVRAALIALQTADARLTHLDRPQLFALRKAIGRDIARLRAAPYVDVPGLSLKLDGVIEQIDSLPVSPGKPALVRPSKAPPATNETWWQRFEREARGDFTRLVRVQNMDKAQLPLLAPDQAYFARENVKLRLLSARLALLARDDKSYRSDVQAAQTWLHQYYDDKDPAVKNVLTILRQVSASQTRVDVPDITASLDALHNVKLAPDRGGR